MHLKRASPASVAPVQNQLPLYLTAGIRPISGWCPHCAALTHQPGDGQSMDAKYRVARQHRSQVTQRQRGCSSHADCARVPPANAEREGASGAFRAVVMAGLSLTIQEQRPKAMAPSSSSMRLEVPAGNGMYKSPASNAASPAAKGEPQPGCSTFGTDTCTTPCGGRPMPCTRAASCVKTQGGRCGLWLWARSLQCTANCTVANCSQLH